MKYGVKSVLLFTALAMLSVLIATVPVVAGSLYLGGGVQANSFGADLDKSTGTSPHKRALGWSGNVGLKLSDKTAIDAVYGISKHDQTAGGAKSTYTWIEVGPKFSFNTDSKIQPYVTLGAGTYKIDIDGSERKGSGGFVGAGIEERGGRNHVVGIFIKGSTWRDDSPKLDVWTLSGGLNYMYHFGGF